MVKFTQYGNLKLDYYSLRLHVSRSESNLPQMALWCSIHWRTGSEKRGEEIPHMSQYQLHKLNIMIRKNKWNNSLVFIFLRLAHFWEQAGIILELDCWMPNTAFLGRLFESNDIQSWNTYYINQKANNRPPQKNKKAHPF